jgi:hypothetical protein
LYASGIYDNGGGIYDTHLENTNVPLTLSFKINLNNKLEQLGLPTAAQTFIHSREAVELFPHVPFIVKPSKSTISFSNYSFAYKVYKSKSEFFNAVDAEVPDFFTSTKMHEFIIQQAFNTDNQKLAQLYINGNGQIIIESIGSAKTVLDTRYDEDPTWKYPWKNPLIYTEREIFSQNDQYGLLAVVRPLIDSYNTRNTPMLVEFFYENGNCYVTDTGFHLARRTIQSRTFTDSEIISVLGYIYDTIPVFDQPSFWLTGITIEVTCDVGKLINYGKTLGIKPTGAWATPIESQLMDFTCRGSTQAEVRRNIALFKNFALRAPQIKAFDQKLY